MYTSYLDLRPVLDTLTSVRVDGFQRLQQIYDQAYHVSSRYYGSQGHMVQGSLPIDANTLASV
jgi:hypothetical protein